HLDGLAHRYEHHQYEQEPLHDEPAVHPDGNADASENDRAHVRLRLHRAPLTQGTVRGGIAVDSFPMQADSAASPGPVSAPAGVRQLLDRRQFAEAARAAEALLARSPEDRNLLYMLAVAQRYLGRIPAALGTLARLEELHPDYPRLHQEKGHCHVAQRSSAPAIAAFERAVALNPALPGSWRTLQSLYGMVGRRACCQARAPPHRDRHRTQHVCRRRDRGCRGAGATLSHRARR